MNEFDKDKHYNISIKGYMGIISPNPVRGTKFEFEEDATEDYKAAVLFTYTQWNRLNRKAKKRNVKIEALIDKAIARGDHLRYYKYLLENN